MFMGLYAVERFLIEVFRAKGDRFIFGLSTAQGLSVLLAIAAVVVWQRQRSAPESIAAAARDAAAHERGAAALSSEP
jgi:prolipoprotein diacylglyceryltransferase